MLNLEQAGSTADTTDRDLRLTLPTGAGDVPDTGLLGRRAFALAPWIVVTVALVAYGLGEVLRGLGTATDWPAAGAAFALAGLTAGVAAVQDLPIGLRYRRALWVYAVGGAIVLAVLASFAAGDAGLTSAVYGAVCPLALYFGLVSPPAWRYRALFALFATTAGVQLARPADAWFDVVVVWSLIVAAWGCGVVVSVGQARTAIIIRRLGGYDRHVRALSRRAFMEQLEFATLRTAVQDGPIALLLIDVDLARVSALDGDDGERVLGWIGAAVPAVLPGTAEFGRLSDGEFGVLLLDIHRHAAHEIAQEVQAALAARLPATVGVATSESRALHPADLLRVADAARAVAHDSGASTYALVAGTLPGAAGAASHVRAVPVRPSLRYADLRATGKAPRVVEEDVMRRRIATISMLLVTAAGVPIVLRGVVEGGGGTAAQVLMYGGLPWLLWTALLTEFSRRWAGSGRRAVELFLHGSLVWALVAGLSVSSLADGGLASPLVAAFFLKTMFDAIIMPRGVSIWTLVLMLGAWAVVAAFSPAADLWVVPLHLALFAGCFALGTLGRSAMDETAEYARSRAFVDDLTQLSNRAGFRDLAEEAFFESATTTGQPFALLTFRITGLRAYNERHGYAAGDGLLRDLADLLEDRIPASYVIGRTGAAEFSAAVMVAGAHATAGLARDLSEEIGARVAVEAGWASCPTDGASVGALMHQAERAAGLPRTRVA